MRQLACVKPSIITYSVLKIQIQSKKTCTSTSTSTSNPISSLHNHMTTTSNLKLFNNKNYSKSSIKASTDPEINVEKTDDIITEEEKSESQQLRDAETFMIIGEGDATCTSCGYEYMMKNGDPDFPVSPGTRFSEVPDDYQCPLCGASRDKFKSSAKTLAGFSVNQKYGFGTNSMTGDEKQLLIFGSLFFFFLLFLAGYFLN